MPLDRIDRTGLWWSDFPVATVRQANRDRVTPVEPPDTGWTPPKDFPNLSSATILGLDTETKDLELLERGPGAVRGAAHAVGISLSTEDASWYFPLRHEYAPQQGLNLEVAKVFAWLNDVLARPIPIVGANLLYDLEVLRAEGVRLPAGPLWDVQFAEPLLDESAVSYSLDTLARKHLNLTKETPALYKWCRQSFGGKEGDDQRKNIWRAPPTLVGPYAEADARLPLQILAKQRPLLEAEELTELFEIECGLIPILIDMRFRGVRVDVDKAQQTAQWLRQQAKEAQAKIPGVDVWSNDSVAKAFDKAGVEYPTTEIGNPSFTKQWLENAEHELAQAVLDVRLYEKAANPFVEHFILENAHKGRVHCQFHPLRSQDYGTVSGRFSSSSPNLQQIPARHKVIAPLLRGLFIPDEGCRWVKIDESQIEYRGLAHYAVGKNAEVIRQQYVTDPKTDFHEATQRLVEQYTGIRLDRRPAKNLNFGLCIAAGSLVLTDKGVLPIEEVPKGVRLWDGMEWVTHGGIVCNGVKDTITYDGVTATPEHIVWTKDSGPLSLTDAALSQCKLLVMPGANNRATSLATQRAIVYDILDAGPRNRFTVNGRLVHNCYGMGKEKLIRSLGVDPDLGQRLYDAYFEALPAVRATYRGAERLAARRGYIRTVLKRRRRFKDGEGTHKALNALLQGTAADIMKKAMRDIYAAGLTRVLGAPHLTVHDELDWSDPQTKESAEAFREVEYIMTHCIKLRVPLYVDTVYGSNWGECG